MLGLPENYLDDANLEQVEQDLTADPRLRALAAEVLHLRHVAGPFMGQISFESGTFSAQVTGQTVETISLAFVSHFKAEGAENFLEMNIYDRNDPAEHYTLTVQRVNGKSPAQLLAEAKSRIAALETL